MYSNEEGVVNITRIYLFIAVVLNGRREGPERELEYRQQQNRGGLGSVQWY